MMTKQYETARSIVSGLVSLIEAIESADEDRHLRASARQDGLTTRQQFLAIMLAVTDATGWDVQRALSGTDFKDWATLTVHTIRHEAEQQGREEPGPSLQDELAKALDCAIRQPGFCPVCGRDNTGHEGCTSDDCPAVQALAKAGGPA